MSQPSNPAVETVYDPETDTASLYGSILYRPHDRSLCEGEGCVIHHQSDHHMRHMPQHWRSDRYLMERICEHGIGHPDPDDPKAKDPVESVHGCCGVCCTTRGEHMRNNEEG